VAIPAYSSKGTKGSVNGDACVGTWDCAPACPSTVAAGDILIAVIYATCFAGTVDTASPATGWTALKSIGLGTQRAVVTFYKVADGTEDSTTPSFSGGFSAPGISGNGNIYLYTGSGTGGVVPASGTTNSGSSTSATMSNVTTTAANSLAVCIVVSGGSIADATGEAGGDWTKAATTDNISSVNVANQTAGMASVGSITGGTAAISPSTNWWTLSFEIKEAVAAGIPNKAVGGNFAVKRANFF
jgi:hypothetical protein